MKAVILAGGLGTRITEESMYRPKPMIEIGTRPILWHIMKCYSAHGINEFVICCGYKGHMIKEYFANYFLHMSDVTFDIERNTMTVHDRKAEPWRVTVVDTGLTTATGGRIKRVADYVADETFCLTYGDGLSDVDIRRLLAFHQARDAVVTMTAVKAPARFGAVEIAPTGAVDVFQEKPQADTGWINGGFLVLEPAVLSYIEDDETSFEQFTLEHLARAGKLAAYKHEGFWLGMDHLRDKMTLDALWDKGAAPWKVW